MAARIAEEVLRLQAQKPFITHVDDGTTIRAQTTPDIQKIPGMIQGLVDNQNKVQEKMLQKFRTPYKNQKQERQPSNDRVQT